MRPLVVRPDRSVVIWSGIELFRQRTSCAVSASKESRWGARVSFTFGSSIRPARSPACMWAALVATWDRGNWSSRKTAVWKAPLLEVNSAMSFKLQPTLEGELLRLRPLRLDDYEALF